MLKMRRLMMLISLIVGRLMVKLLLGCRLVVEVAVLELERQINIGIRGRLDGVSASPPRDPSGVMAVLLLVMIAMLVLRRMGDEEGCLVRAQGLAQPRGRVVREEAVDDRVRRPERHPDLHASFRCCPRRRTWRR